MSCIGNLISLNVYDPFKSQTAVFLDRDGTIIKDTGYISSADDVELLEGSIEGLKLLQKQGILLFIVSNQAGIAYGKFDNTALENVHRRFVRLLDESGIKISGYAYCPYHENAVLEEYRKISDLRKPAIGMILGFLYRHNVDLKRSWMIGDRPSDIISGKAAGLRTIRIRSDHPYSDRDLYDYLADNLYDAARFILNVLRV